MDIRCENVRKGVKEVVVYSNISAYYKKRRLYFFRSSGDFSVGNVIREGDDRGQDQQGDDDYHGQFFPAADDREAQSGKFQYNQEQQAVPALLRLIVTWEPKCAYKKSKGVIEATFFSKTTSSPRK